jgi:hypothetical protein
MPRATILGDQVDSRLAEAGMAGSRKFNHAIPLLDLLFLASRNVNTASQTGRGRGLFALNGSSGSLASSVP